MAHTSGRMATTTQHDSYTQEQAEARFPSNPNLLINGDLQVWQRGTSFAGHTGGYTADRISVNTGGGSLLVEQKPMPDLGVATPEKRFANALRVTAENTITSGIFCYKMESEDLRQLTDGGTYTMQMWVRGSKVGTLSNFGRCHFTGPGTNVDLGQSVSIDTNWQLVTYTGSIGDGVDLSSVTRANFYMAAGLAGYLSAANDWFEVAGIKLEAGDQATPLQPRIYGEELTLCQRYYQRFSEIRQNSQYLTVFYFVLMRSAPSVSYSNGTGGNVTAIYPVVDRVIFRKDTSGDNQISNIAADAEL